MKFLMTLTVIFGFIATSSATTLERQDEYYQPEYEFVSVQPMCPNSVPGEAVCLAYGAMITIKATLRGCLDKVEFIQVNHVKEDNKVKLNVVAVAKWDADNILVRCIQQNVVTKTVPVPYMSFEAVEVNNIEIQKY